MNFFNDLKLKIIAVRDKLDTYEVVINIRGKAGIVHPVLDLHFFKIISAILLILVSFLFLEVFFWRAPSPFPDYSLVSVPKGEHLSEIADTFKQEGIIRSSTWLEFFIMLNGGDKRVIAGDYYFPHAENIFQVTHALLYGEFGLSQIKVSLPEGLNTTEMAGQISLVLPHFDKQGFIDEAKKDEGYLFPDTYFFMPNQKPADIISMMRENFARKTESLTPDIEKFGHPLSDDITMASILEDEAKTIDDKRIIAGILWKRLKQGMPLQVDSTIRYNTGQTSSELTSKELADKSNPYNTYANKGLPPSPISNPGLDSIRAAITPTNTKYFYFLSDKNGVMHYAVTFAEHKANRELYIK